jgi:uncharacterized Zn finger protein (UPF0148 family)
MSSDETASRLSTKLLQGWCMLDASCEKCFTPLMRDKEKKDYCCGCQLYLNDTPKPLPPSAPQTAHFEPTKASLKIDLCIQKYAEDLLQSDTIEKALKITEILEKLAGIYKTLN